MFKKEVFVFLLMLITLNGASVARAEETDISRRIYLVLDGPRAHVYVNEIVPVSLKVCSDWLDLEELTVSEPMNAGLVAGEFEKGDTKIIEEDGISYVVLEFKKTFFATEPGECEFGPVEVNFNVAKPASVQGQQAELLNDNALFYENFIGARKKFKPMKLVAEPLKLKIERMPVEGRPGWFQGAVGRFDLKVQVDWSDLDPLGLVKIISEVSGDGNLSTVTPPEIKLTEGLVLRDSASERRGNSVVFRQVVEVRSGSAEYIPPVRFAFFDPVTERYVSLEKGPFRIERKAKPETKAKEAAAAEKKLPEDIIAAKLLPGKIYHSYRLFFNSGIVLSLIVFPLFIVVASAVEHRRRWILTSDSDEAVYIRSSGKAVRALRKARTCMAKNSVKDFYQTVFDSVQDYVGERFALAKGNITEAVIDEVIMSKDELKGIGEKVKSVMSDCYRAKFTNITLDAEDMSATYDKFKKAVDEMSEYKSFK